MIKNKIHKCWRLGAGILLLNIAIFTVGCSSKSVDSKETTTNSETTVAQTTVPETTTVNYKKLINFKAEHPFYIKVNKKENFAIVYGIDKKGKYSVPYKAFVCSTGRENDFTPNGTFTVSEKYRWRLMIDNTYAQYAVRIQGQIMLHSVPYTSPESDALEYWEYNKLGNVASLGCVRFQVADIKWIYDNCPEGTKVKIYSKSNEEPVLPLPEMQKLNESDPRSSWDPSDPDENNPWNTDSKTSKKKRKKKKKETETTTSYSNTDSEEETIGRETIGRETTAKSSYTNNKNTTEKTTKKKNSKPKTTKKTTKKENTTKKSNTKETAKKNTTEKKTEKQTEKKTEKITKAPTKPTAKATEKVTEAVKETNSQE